MSIPPFVPTGLLPLGTYSVTFEELRHSHLVTGHGDGDDWDSPWRSLLVDNAEVLVSQLWQVGITEVFLDGSFIEAKPHPNDIDGYFECDAASFARGEIAQMLNALDPYKTWTWAQSARRPAQGSLKKQLPMWHRYRVEFYPHFPGVSSGITDPWGNELPFPSAAGYRLSKGHREDRTVIGCAWHSPCIAAQSASRPQLGAEEASHSQRESYMIRTDAEYQDAVKRLQQDQKVIQAQREKLKAMGLNDQEVERGVEPSLSFHDQLREEVEVYERMRRGDITPIESLTHIGRVLVGLRIARGITQRELADRLHVSESQVSRDERNDYHGITVERAQRIITALKGRVRVEAEAPIDEAEFAIV